MMLSGLVLIFSPNNVNAIPVTFENWDGYNIGDKSGSTIYGNWVGDWTQPVADWQVSNAWSYSGTNSYRSNTPHNGDNVTGYYNITTDFEFVPKVTIYVNILATANNDNAAGYSSTITLYNDKSEVNKLDFAGNKIAGTAYHYLRLYDYNHVKHEMLHSTVGDFNHALKIVIEHTTLNLYSYKFYWSSNNTYINGSTISGRNSNSHTTYDQIRFSASRYHSYSNLCTTYIDNIVFLQGVPGNTTINVYNETSPSSAIPDWNLRIYDENNVIHYSKNTLDNPITVNHTEYGNGGHAFFEISATGYYNRTYYADIKSGIHYILDAFLLNTLNPDAHIYTCIVVDDSDLDHIIYINDATITITRVINGSIHEISSGFTDGSGRFYVPLIAGVTYTVNITATGYDDLQDIYIPSSTEFEHTFRMATSTPSSTSYDDFWENISIDISMVSAGCMQDGNITITYLDSNSSTNNTEIRLFEIYGTTNTLLNTWTNTSNSFFNINSSINTTRVHFMSLYFNNTAFFTVSQPIVVMIPNVDSPFCDRVIPFDLDDRITKIVGPFTIEDRTVPYPDVIATFIPIILLVAFGPFNTGLGIIMCGISMTMIEGFFGMYLTSGFNWGIAGIGAFIAIMGIMYVMTKGTGGDHL